MTTVSPQQHYYHHRGGLIAGGREADEAEAAAFYARQMLVGEVVPGIPTAAPVPPTAALPPNGEMMRVESEAHLPPTKRQCNNVTRVRIGVYVRLKEQVEGMLKGGAQDPAVLVLLRQLRYLEESVGAGRKPPYTPETVESVLLEALSSSSSSSLPL